MRLFILTSLAMIAFAANSVFARLGLLGEDIDAASYTAIRLISGAIVLAILVWRKNTMQQAIKSEGNWVSAIALFAYAAAFSFAYLALDTGMGALILFFCVQATMIGWGLWGGHKPQMLEWAGLTIAFIAFVGLVSPGSTAPDLWASALMIASGIAWGIYSLRGRGTALPLEATAGNFIRTIPMALVLLIAMSSGLALSSFGVVMALASGAITSALGYALWYECLKSLTPSKAAIIQLSAPAIATLGGIALLGEPLTLRLALCSIAILGGVALAISVKDKG